MQKSMTLIEPANIFNRTIHRNLFFDRTHTKKNVDVYSSRPLLPTLTQSTKHYPTEKFILPQIERKKIKRPAYRTSLYHSNASSSTNVDHSLLTARGKKPESISSIKDDETIINFQRHHAPPPSPSDDQIERILSELNRTRRSTPQSPEEIDGNIPYRLPALDHSGRRKRTVKDSTSTLSNYLQTYY
jgi:hypothetical protein